MVVVAHIHPVTPNENVYPTIRIYEEVDDPGVDSSNLQLSEQ
jgi:hypothetical protein